MHNKTYTMTEKTAFGSITVTSDGEHLIGLYWENNQSTSSSNADAICHEAFKQLREYEKGTRKEFDLPIKLNAPPKTVKRLEQLRNKVPYGDVTSYSGFAKRAGESAKAARAFGSVCANNPIPIIYPCHRITRKDGRLGNYGGISDLDSQNRRNLALKERLIAHEKNHA